MTLFALSVSCDDHAGKKQKNRTAIFFKLSIFSLINQTGSICKLNLIYNKESDTELFWFE